MITEYFFHEIEVPVNTAQLSHEEMDDLLDKVFVDIVEDERFDEFALGCCPGIIDLAAETTIKDIQSVEYILIAYLQKYDIMPSSD